LKRPYIAIADYGMGNIGNVKNAFDFLGIRCRVASAPKELSSASGILLPGVGSFGAAAGNLRKSGLADVIRGFISENRPFLGVCLGLQLLFEESEESGRTKGLGIFKGRVLRFKTKKLKVPHMGWNSVRILKRPFTLKNVKQDTYFYFVHSYFASPEDRSLIACLTGYGKDFTSGIASGNTSAFQFHPEKSQDAGLRIYKNFGELCFKS
jgi:imidazole glycerol-phosphate synthase subunit HisH